MLERSKREEKAINQPSMNEGETGWRSRWRVAAEGVIDEHAHTHPQRKVAAVNGSAVEERKGVVGKRMERKKKKLERREKGRVLGKVFDSLREEAWLCCRQ